MESISGLRYRADDAMRAVSRRAVRLARRKEIEEEIINSEKLKVIVLVILKKLLLL
jgi:ATP-dependent RNA helicase DDX56/DBP9